MIPQELNEQLTDVRPESAAGKVLRQYWQPAALLDEIKPDRLLPINLLDEKLVLQSMDDGSFVLKERVHCQNESPVLHPRQVQIKESDVFYPTIEKNGIIFAYLGDGSPPDIPNFDCFRAPSTHSFAFKGLWECNWLQALEIGIDPAHASFLHRFLEDEKPEDAYGKQFRDKSEGADIPMTKILRDYPRPEIDVEETDYGLKITALRHMEHELTHVRVTNCIFPEAICIPMSREMTITQWHVPVDRMHCYWYTMFTSFKDPVNKELMRSQRLAEHTLPEYLPKKNKTNNYKYDPVEQQKLTYTGMGLDINVHDQWAVEMMGNIQDRTREHLGRSDKAIVRFRRMFRKAMASFEKGEILSLPMRKPATRDLVGPLSNDAISPSSEWKNKSHDADMTRRNLCPWDASV